MSRSHHSDTFPSDESSPNPLELLDYRRQVFGLYAQVRHQGAGEEAWRRFRVGRDELFARHPQSALPEADRAAFTGLPYYPYNPKLRYTTKLELNVEPQEYEITLRDDGNFRLRRVGHVRVDLEGEAVSLSLYRILGYGGGLFLPFGDATNASETYGGGRYLLDTTKGADLGSVGEQLVLDFNYAYNPSCAYDARWHCPLAPLENKLAVPVRAGERLWQTATPSSAVSEGV
jgi:uncharacterized protein (DUF1684 family)